MEIIDSGAICQYCHTLYVIDNFYDFIVNMVKISGCAFILSGKLLFFGGVASVFLVFAPRQ